MYMAGLLTNGAVTVQANSKVTRQSGPCGQSSRDFTHQGCMYRCVAGVLTMGALGSPGWNQGRLQRKAMLPLCAISKQTAMATIRLRLAKVQVQGGGFKGGTQQHAMAIAMAWKSRALLCRHSRHDLGAGETSMHAQQPLIKYGGIQLHAQQAEVRHKTPICMHCRHVLDVRHSYACLTAIVKCQGTQLVF